MNNQFLLELLGYTASGLVAISLMMSSLLRLRIINSIGALCFTAYGVLIGAYPVAVVNFAILLINFYHLYQRFSAREYFTLLEVKPDSAYLQSFLKFHQSEIAKSSPGFVHATSGRQLHTFVLRNMVPAGLLIGELRPDDTLRIDLDFATPGYRDFKIGRFLFETKSEFLREKGVRRILSPAGSSGHIRYLKRMGFAPDASDPSGHTYSRRIG